MRISYSWLREFLPLAMAPSDLARHLLDIGLEVSGMASAGPGFSKVVVGHVLEVRPHPNADRLSLCSVTDGRATYPVVCGAKNVAAGAKVPFALVGAVLPGGRTIQAASIRGETSRGMLCSGPELGLGEADDGGIMLLPADAPVGGDFAALAGGPDTVLDVEVTPNRPDLLSHFGMARELSLYFRVPLRERPDSALELVSAQAPEPRLRVAIEARDACGRYVGREFHGLKAGPSPGWLARRLEAVGARPVNSVVDVTNYVLLELGHPLHAFDAARLQGPAVFVRRARAGERLAALDGKTYGLAAEDLVIADASGPVAIAGVIGGEPTGVTSSSKSVFLEAAQFSPAAVRRTSRRLGLRTEASYRFERGTAPESADAAARRAGELIGRLCGGSASPRIDEQPARPDPIRIEVPAGRINRILGTNHAPERVEGLLKALAARVERKGDGLTVVPPPHRLDLATVWDLAEEAGRLLGYDSIPGEAAPVRLHRPKSLPLVELAASLRRNLAAAGFYEAYNADFVSAAQLARCSLSPEAVRAVEVLNPVSEDQAMLRPTLLIGLLANAAYNLSRGCAGLALFEVGTVYDLDGAEVVERLWLGGLLLGQVPARPHWRARPRPADFHDVKGVVEELLRPYPQVALEPGPVDELFHPKAVLQLAHPGGRMGCAGLLHPALLKAWDLPEAAGAFLMNLDMLATLPPNRPAAGPPPQFPAALRDISIVVDEAASYAGVAACLSGLEGLAAVDLLDVYTGPGIRQGGKSLTLRLTFQHQDRSPRDEEVAAAMAKAAEALARGAGAELRGKA